MAPKSARGDQKYAPILARAIGKAKKGSIIHIGMERTEHKREAEAFDVLNRLKIKNPKIKKSVHHGAASHHPEGGIPKVCAAVCSCGTVENNPCVASINPEPPANSIGTVDFSMVIIDGIKRRASLIPNMRPSALIHQIHHEGIVVRPIMREEEEFLTGGSGLLAIDSSVSSNGGMDCSSNVVSYTL